MLTIFRVIFTIKQSDLSASTGGSVVWQELLGSSQILDLSATLPFFSGLVVEGRSCVFDADE